MGKTSFRQIKAIENANKKKLLELNRDLNDDSGIYFLIREDENGFKFSYVGQSLHILTRLAQHMVGYTQHIDLSLRKRGFYSEDNPYGWRVYHLNFSTDLLDEKEKMYIKLYADNGYQCLNVTAGGQGKGKTQLQEYKPSKGYYDGLKQGKKQLAKELSHIIEKHLEIGFKEGKEHNKVSQKAREKFFELLNEENYKEV
jgi:hypothetical protein